MDSDILDKDGFISKVAQKAMFTKSDVRIILDKMIEVFEECVEDNVVIKIRGLGKLTIKVIEPHEGYNAVKGEYQQFQESKRVNFKLSANITRMSDDGDD